MKTPPKSRSERFSASDLHDIRQLCDVATEEAQADLWTRHQLTPGAAMGLLAEFESTRSAIPPNPSTPRHPRQRKKAASELPAFIQPNV